MGVQRLRHAFSSLQHLLWHTATLEFWKLVLIQILIKKHDCYSLTRFCHSLDGNILFVGHEAQHREDSKTCHKAGAAVQTTQHDAVPEEQDRENKKIAPTARAVSGPYTSGNTDFLYHTLSCTDMLCDEWKIKLYKMCQSIHSYQSIYLYSYFLYAYRYTVIRKTTFN